MALTRIDIARLVEEIAPVVTGGWIQKVYQPAPRTLVLEIRAPGHTHRLLLSAQPGLARLHLVTQPLHNPPTPPAFCQYLRAHLQGARIEAMQQLDRDRIVALSLTTKDGPRRLVAELTGHTATLVVLDAEDRILKDLNHSKDRSGQPYHPPPAPDALRLHEDKAHFTPKPDTPCGLSAAVEAHYQDKESLDALTAQRDARASQLKKAIKKQQRRIEAWQADLVKAERYRDYARYGELLKANLGTMKKGQEAVTVVDYFDEALPHVTIPLDPTKSAHGNMDDYFRKQRKFDTAQHTLTPRIFEGERELAVLRQELASIQQGTWQPPAPLPSTPGHAAHRTTPSPSPRPSIKAGPFRRFTSSDGLPIFVGRNARENDELTFGLAKSDDLWLHARGVPGSHVVVRLDKGTEVPPDTLRDAATLALLYSDLKKSGKGDVIYTRRKWVKKAKGQAPGAVTVTQDKSIHVSLDRQRLERLKGDRMA